MIDRMPPELFSQQPIRSNFSRRRENPARMRKIVVLAIIIGLVLGAGSYLAFVYLDNQSPAEIPTIKAENQLKVRPEQPGGIEIPHQDEMVFQKIEGSTPENQPQVEHLLPEPQPPQPVETSQTVQPGEQKTEESQSVEPTKSPETAPSDVVQKPQLETAPVTSPQVNLSEKNVVNLTPASEPEAVKKEETPQPATIPPEQKAVVNQSVAKKEPTINTSLPKEMLTAEEPKVVGPKKFAVQLGSFPDKDNASVQMKKMQGKYSSVLSGLDLKLARADIKDKGVYYRIQGGPLAESEARSMCAKLKNQKAACIVVRP